MKNPWVHDDVPEGRSIYKSRAKLLGAAIWVSLFLLAGVLFFFSGGDTGVFAGTEGLSTATTVLLATFAIVLSLPLILKLLAVSRLLAMFALLSTWSLIGRFVLELERETLAEIESVEAAREAVAEAMEPLGELAEILEEFPEAIEELPTSATIALGWTSPLFEATLMIVIAG